MRDREYIAKFLGHRIAVQDGQEPNHYRLLILWGMFACDTALVGDKTGGNLRLIAFDDLTDPYMLLTDPTKEIIG